nr:LytR C-terminal domain-containing protein [Tessaracoccus sp. OS52]
MVNVTQVSVRIYNGGFTSGLARRQAARLEDVGFKVIRVGNTDERVTGTVVRANEKDAPAIRLITSYFKEVKFENDDRTDGTVDVLLGSEFAGEGESPIFQVSPGEAGTVCLPPSPSPSGSPSGSPSPSPQPTDA